MRARRISNLIFFTAFSIAFIPSIILGQEAPSDFDPTKFLNEAKRVALMPFKARLISPGVEASFYRRVLPGGLICTRVEYVKPSKRITLSIGSDSYDIYPEANVAIRMDFSQASQRQFDGSLVPSPSFDARSGIPKFEGQTLQGGRKVYTFAQHLDGTVVSGLLSKLPVEFREQVNRAMPDKILTSIDGETFQIRGITYFRGASVLSWSRFDDPENPGDLPDSLFAVPKGMEIRVAATAADYVGAISNILAKKLKLPPGWVYDPVSHHIYKAGSPAIGVPPKATSDFSTGTSRSAFIRWFVLAAMVSVTLAVGFRMLTAKANPRKLSDQNLSH